MAFSSRIKDSINAMLNPLNLRVGTCTSERLEAARLAHLVQCRHFVDPVFPILSQFSACNPGSIIEALKKYAQQIEKLSDPSAAGYTFENEYFTSPDAEVAYVLVNLFRPMHIVEVGSGNSSRLFRQAISNFGLKTKLTCIDPSPRREIRSVADNVVEEHVENLPRSNFDNLEANDILFIDSSHRASIGSDVVNLVLGILPILKSGVLVHFHDVFLPFEYPREWMVDDKRSWNEQYFLQALLQGSSNFEVLWPGHFLQKTHNGFADIFDSRYLRVASSLWLRKIL